MPLQLTPHFNTDEFSQPSDYGLDGKDYPSEWIESRLLPLCNVLEALRLELRGMPIKIISGYRSYVYNERHHIAHPGASLFSQHCEGRAADIQVPFYSPIEVHRTLLNMYQLKAIIIGGLGLYSNFVHVDIREGELSQWKG